LREPAGTNPEKLAASPAGLHLQGELRQTLQAAQAADRRRLLEDQVGRMAASLLRIEVGAVESGQPLRNQGLDSLAASELALTLAHRLDLAVPQTLVWNHPTIQAIASHLLEQLGMKLADLPPGLKLDHVNLSARGGTPPETLLSEIARLSDEQARTLLDLLPAPPGRNPE
jgi:acyl carrier protein